MSSPGTAPPKYTYQTLKDLAARIPLYDADLTQPSYFRSVFKVLIGKAARYNDYIYTGSGVLDKDDAGDTVKEHYKKVTNKLLDKLDIFKQLEQAVIQRIRDPTKGMEAPKKGAQTSAAQTSTAPRGTYPNWLPNLSKAVAPVAAVKKVYSGMSPDDFREAYTKKPYDVQPRILAIKTHLIALLDTNQAHLDRPSIVAYIGEVLTKYFYFPGEIMAREEGPWLMNMCVVGRPGTGKSTIVRFLGAIMKTLQLLVEPNPNIQVATEKDLVGGYVGHTTKLTDAYIQNHLEDVVFIDEAYSIVGSGAKDDKSAAEGKKAIETLLTSTDKNRGLACFVLGGYEGPIDEFLAANEGLQRRFPNRVRLDPLTPEAAGNLFAKESSLKDDLAPNKSAKISPRAMELFKAVYAASIALYETKERNKTFTKYLPGRLFGNNIDDIIKFRLAAKDLVTEQPHPMVTEATVGEVVRGRIFVKFTAESREEYDYILNSLAATQPPWMGQAVRAPGGQLPKEVTGSTLSSEDAAAGKEGAEASTASGPADQRKLGKLEAQYASVHSELQNAKLNSRARLEAQNRAIAAMRAQLAGPAVKDPAPSRGWVTSLALVLVGAALAAVLVAVLRWLRGTPRHQGGSHGGGGWAGPPRLAAPPRAVKRPRRANGRANGRANR